MGLERLFTEFQLDSLHLGTQC